jgi:hypothetical protein
MLFNFFDRLIPPIKDGWSSSNIQCCVLPIDETYVLGAYYNGIWKEWEKEINEKSIY